MSIQNNKLPDNPKIEVIKTGKTGLFTNYIYKAIPLAFDESMSYYECLCGLLDYLKNVIIPTVNNNADAVAELQSLYIQLKNYVDNAINEYEESINNKVESLENYMNNYFDNLDVQEEINNKLDAMVKDGTFQKLVENVALPILNNLSNRVESLADEVETATNDIDTKIEQLRKDNYNLYKPYYIDFTADIFKKFNIFRSNDRQNIKVVYDINDFKNTPTNTYYVSPNGNDTNNGTSESTPWKSIGYAVRNAIDGATIIIEDGVYLRDGVPNALQPVVRNFNLIGKGHPLLAIGDNLTWTQNETYSNIYQATRSNVLYDNVIDIRNRDKGLYPKLTQVDSLESCSNTLNSYYYRGTTLYVNIGEEVTSNKVIALLQTEASLFNIVPDTVAINVYMENLTIMGSNIGCVSIDGANYKPTVCFNKVDFYYGGSYLGNNVNISASDTIFNECKVCYGFKDGINYTNASNGIEIKCLCSNNGRDYNNTNNGSTGHTASKILRIDGNYFNNRGGNVADVHVGTESYNFNCNAFDSVSTDILYSQDFSAQQNGTIMHLINCYAKGSSYDNVYCVTGATMYLDNVEYDRQHGGGNFIIVE